jgi:hypothetical protein
MLGNCTSVKSGREYSVLTILLYFVEWRGRVCWTEMAQRDSIRESSTFCWMSSGHFAVAVAGNWPQLVERVTAMGSRGSFFCVGDKKQAIYDWRGGVAEIFDAVESRLAGRLEPAIHSSPVAFRATIIDTVNRTFANLGAVNEPETNRRTARFWIRFSRVFRTISRP